MLIDNQQEYNLIWDKVDEKLKFNPSCEYRGHSMKVSLPFQINGNYDDLVFRIDTLYKDKRGLLLCRQMISRFHWILAQEDSEMNY